jgi:nitrile hydratase accessory protein
VAHPSAPAPLDPAVAGMTGAAALPRRNGELVFEAPWQGRALGMALAVVERLGLPWRAFQEHLIAAIAARPEAPYYDCFVAALEELLVARGVVAHDEVDRAAALVDHD